MNTAQAIYQASLAHVGMVHLQDLAFMIGSLESLAGECLNDATAEDCRVTLGALKARIEQRAEAIRRQNLAEDREEEQREERGRQCSCHAPELDGYPQRLELDARHHYTPVPNNATTGVPA